VVYRLKTVIFLPIVFSVTASSLVFTQIFQLDPTSGPERHRPDVTTGSVTWRVPLSAGQSRVARHERSRRGSSRRARKQQDR